MGEEQTENLLGALSLSVTDRVLEAVTGASVTAPAGAATLSALHHLVEGPSIDRLRRVLGLTSSGTVRLVDRLVAAGLVRRDVGDDGRVSTVRLTAAGRRTAEQLTAARTEVLDAALAVLSPAEQRELNALLGRLLVGMIRPPGAVRFTCRLCDTRACGREEGRCPVATATGYRPG